MKKTFRRILSTLLVAVMLVGIAPVGGIDLNVKGSAESGSSYKTGDIIEFGSYPQSKVTDSATVSKLDGVTKNWKSYNYYSGTGNATDGNMKPSNYMQYADITYGGNKYRAVTFSEYRPYWTGDKSSSDNSNQCDNGYYTGNVYYFKYEPLKWRVLDASTGLVVCDSVIDSQAYQNIVYYNGNSEYILYNGKDCTNYASDWETSSLRRWLNDDFYNTAFSKLQQDRIQELTRENKSVDDSLYDSNPTSDNITLLSLWDVTNENLGFNSSAGVEDTARQRKSTDYARCQGCQSYTYNGSCSWRLRSPYDSINVASVGNGGWASDDFYFANITEGGIVPAFNFKPGVLDSSAESILAFAEDPALCVEAGDSMNLRFALTKDGGETIYEGWSQPALTIGDKSVISVSSMTSENSVYGVNIKGLKVGSSSLVITDTKTGKSLPLTITVMDRYSKNRIYAIDKMPEFYPDNEFEKDKKTNIYNRHGIYVNNYSAKYDPKTGGYDVSFTAYNSQYVTGAVDVYDKDGNWIKCEEIKRKSNISSLKDTAIQGFYLVNDFVTGKRFTYDQHSFSEESEISFKVPKDGYFTISNNFRDSFGTFLYNSSEILLNGLKTVVGDAIDLNRDDCKIDVAKLVAETAKEKNLSEEMDELADSTLAKLIDKISGKYVSVGVDQLCKEYSDTLLEILDALEIDFKDAVSVTFGVGESKLLKAFGPGGTVLESCFSFSELAETVTQVEEIAKSVNVDYTKVVTSLDNGYVNDNGISVITNGNINKEAILQTFRVSSSDIVEAILDPQNPYEQYELYNICFVKDDQYVQPNGKVTVKIPVPNNMKGDSCKIYRQEKNRKWTVLQAYRSGDYLCFETDHFSFYALVYDIVEPEIVKLPNKLDYVIGERIDLSGLKLKLNGKEISSGFMCKESLAYKIGKQTVTVLYGDSELEFDINVKNPTVKSVSIGDITLNYKKSTTLKPTITADEGAEYTVRYYSSNTKVATVDNNGKVTATKRGSGVATIACAVTDSNGNTVADTCKVNVSMTWWQWIITVVLFGWIWY